jgi:hypothetical protein
VRLAQLQKRMTNPTQSHMNGRGISYYIDEPDCGNPDCPLHGPRADTRFYDSLKEAESEAEKLTQLRGIYFTVWEHEE